MIGIVFLGNKLDEEGSLLSSIRVEGSLASSFSTRRGLTNSGVVRGLALMLAELGHPSSLALNLLITLLLFKLSIEKCLSCPLFSLMPTNFPGSSFVVLGKLLTS